MIDRTIILAFIIIMLIGTYLVSDSAYVYGHSRAGSIVRVQATADQVEEAIKTFTDDAVGWICIDGTNVNYPIMHCDNNTKYLNLDPYGEYSLSGSIFLDCRNKGDFSEPYMILYGHHMSQGYMFGALDSYESEKYMDEHRTGTLIVNGKEYKLNVFGCSISDATEPILFDPHYAPENVHGYLTGICKVYREPEGYPILALSTCRDPAHSTLRTLVYTEILADD